jgi:DNA repair exonuclease SbcCD nuclease subunit
MNSTLIIGDIHLHNRFPGYLDAQVNSILKIIKDSKCMNIILLGDVFEKRRPSPTELLAFKNLLDLLYGRFYILKGNHDMENKSDDSPTSLSLFANDEQVSIITEITDTIIGDKYFRLIPFYENESVIINAIKTAESSQILLGHFGFFGSLNTMGISDFTIDPSSINNRCILGHIHSFKQFNENITILGTPYTTNFGESRKPCYVARIEKDGIKFIRNNQGIRHYVCKLEDLENHKDDINDPDYFTLLRVIVNKIGDNSIAKLKEDILSKYNVKYLDIKFSQLYEIKHNSTYNPTVNINEINEGVIEKYIDESNTKISKDSLLKGLTEIKS